MFRTATKPVDLIILGGGAAATAALIELIQQLSNHPSQDAYNILVIERSAVAGAGYPYDPAHHHPTLKVNDSNAGMQLSKDPDKLNDFVVWLKENDAALKQQYPHLTQIIDDNNTGKDRYAPRMLFGLYCRARLDEWVMTARKHHIKITILTNTNIVDAMQTADNNWKLMGEDGKVFIANHLLLATGHLPSCKFPSLLAQANYFDSPYKDLTSIPNEPVIVLGSGLSAIDTIKLLAQQESFSAPIYLVSPSGQLPRIKGPSCDDVYKMKFLIAENLDKKDISLAEVMRLFVEEVRAATGNALWTLEAIMYKVRQENKDPLRALNNEIRMVENGEIRDWQRMLGETWYIPLPLIWKNLADIDRAEFISVYFPYFMKWAAGMTLGNAKEVAALANAGRVHFIQSKNLVTFNAETKMFQLVTEKNQVICAGSAINATGTGYDINDSPVLNVMCRRKLLQQAKFIGGVDVTHDLRLVKPNQELHTNAWAIGVITFGCNLGANSIEIAAMDAKVIAPQITSAIVAAKLKLSPRGALQ